MTALTIDLRPFVVTSDEFYELCAANPELRIERSATGEVIILAPAVVKLARAMMLEYMANGARLGWLIAPHIARLKSMKWDNLCAPSTIAT